MNLKILSLVIIGVCILLPDVCYAFLEKDVHLLNMQNGLADNTVSAVYKDKEGFVWFGTRNGLSRYDGRQITNFEQSNSYPSISNLKEAFDGVLAFVDNVKKDTNGKFVYMVRDFPSLTGTFVKNVLVDKKEQVRIGEGSIVTIGATTFILHSANEGEEEE